MCNFFYLFIIFFYIFLFILPRSLSSSHRDKRKCELSRVNARETHTTVRWPPDIELLLVDIWFVYTRSVVGLFYSGTMHSKTVHRLRYLSTRSPTDRLFNNNNNNNIVTAEAIHILYYYTRHFVVQRTAHVCCAV